MNKFTDLLRKAKQQDYNLDQLMITYEHIHKGNIYRRRLLHINKAKKDIIRKIKNYNLNIIYSYNCTLELEGNIEINKKEILSLNGDTPDMIAWIEFNFRCKVITILKQSHLISKIKISQ